MKRTAKFVLALSLSTPIFASQSTRALDTDRRDVADAQTDGDRLTRIERVTLKGKVLLAHVLRADIRWRQALMDKVGLDHQVSMGAVALGTGTMAAELIAGSMVAGHLKEARFGQLDRDITYNLRELERQEKVAANLKTEANDLRRQVAAEAATAEPAEAIAVSESPAAVRLRQVEDELNTAEISIKRYAERPAKLTKFSDRLRRLGRPVRLFLGGAVITVAAYEGLAALYQISYDPQQIDGLERWLTEYIDDARVTLDNQ